MNVEIKKKNGWSTITAYLLIFFIAGEFVALGILYVIKLLGLSLTDSNVVVMASSLNNFFVYAILLTILLVIQYKDLKAEYVTFRDEEKNKTMTILASFGIFYIISIVFQNLVTMAEQNFNMGYQLFGIYDFMNTTSDNQTVIEQMMQGPSAIPMFLSAVLLGPICEELVFRKAFFDIIEKPEVALIVSSITFGSIHILSSIGMYSLLEIFLMTIPYVASGVALGYVYIRAKKSIYVPIIVHILSNLISMIAIMGM